MDDKFLRNKVRNVLIGSSWHAIVCARGTSSRRWLLDPFDVIALAG